MESAPLVLTAFEPFGGRRRNLSQLVLESWEEAGVEKRVLPVAFRKLPEEVAAILALQPRAWVLLGESRRRRVVDVERLAVNALHAPDRPDNARERATDRRIRDGGPLALECTWDAPLVLEALTKRKVRAGLSFHAGTYACNQALYLALAMSAESTPPPRIGFLHLPAKWSLLPSARAKRLAASLSGLLSEIAGTIPRPVRLRSG